MTQENVEALYRLYEALGRRDREACVRETHPDVEAVSYLMEADGSVYKGHAGVRRFYDDLFSVFPDWHPEILQATDYGDAILAEIRMAGRGAGSGLALEQNIWQVIRFRDGKLVWFHGYGDRAEALEAVGLSE
jgi:ketosteroid isomerase-like protein